MVVENGNLLDLVGFENTKPEPGTVICGVGYICLLEPKKTWAGIDSFISRIRVLLDSRRLDSRILSEQKSYTIMNRL